MRIIITDITRNRRMEEARPSRHSSRNPSLLHSSKNWNQKPSRSDLSTPNRTSVNRIKSKIRDLTRLLRRPENLPADVQVLQERALAGYRQALEQIEGEKRKSQMIGKYHMVRFFGGFRYDLLRLRGGLFRGVSSNVSIMPRGLTLRPLNQNVKKQRATSNRFGNAWRPFRSIPRSIPRCERSWKRQQSISTIRCITLWT